MVDGPAVIEYSALAERLPNDAMLVGPGIAKLDESIRMRLAGIIPADRALHRPHAKHLARLAREKWWNIAPPDIGTLVPEYGIDFPA